MGHEGTELHPSREHGACSPEVRRVLTSVYGYANIDVDLWVRDQLTEAEMVGMGRADYLLTAMMDEHTIGWEVYAQEMRWVIQEAGW